MELCERGDLAGRIKKCQRMRRRVDERTIWANMVEMVVDRCTAQVLDKLIAIATEHVIVAALSPIGPVMRSFFLHSDLR